MARQIGVITNDQSKVFQQGVITGIRQVTGKEGYDLVVDSRIESDSPELPTDLNLDALAGLIVIANVIPDDFLRDLYAHRLPVSLVSHTVADTPMPAVIPNNEQGMRKLVRHVVLDSRRDRLVFINGDLNQHDGLERRRTFLEEMIRLDNYTKPALLIDGHFIPTVARESLQDLLNRTTDFDAIVAADYLMALEAVNVLREQGLRVPQDIAVVGFGDGPEARTHDLTVIAADIHELGQRSARQLIGQINGLHVCGTTLLSVSLEVRATS